MAVILPPPKKCERANNMFLLNNVVGFFSMGFEIANLAFNRELITVITVSWREL